MILLRLRLTQNALQLPFFFFFCFFLSSVLLDGLAKAICLYFIYFCFRHVGPLSDFNSMICRVLSRNVLERQTVVGDLSESMYILALRLAAPAVKRRESTDCTQISITKSQIKLLISAVRIYLSALSLVWAFVSWISKFRQCRL